MGSCQSTEGDDSLPAVTPSIGSNNSSTTDGNLVKMAKASSSSTTTKKNGNGNIGTNMNNHHHHHHNGHSKSGEAMTSSTSTSDRGVGDHDDDDMEDDRSLGSTHSQSKYSKKSGVSSIGQHDPADHHHIDGDDDAKSETSSIGSTGGHTNGTDGGGGTGGGSSSMTRSERSRSNNINSGSNPRLLSHSSSIIGLDSMIENRREEGDLTANVVHMEVPFGKPIEEVYDGVHTGPVLGSGISGQVRLCTHRATGVKYAVKCLDLGLVDTDEGLAQLREEIFIMCQLDHPNIVRLEEVYESHSEIYLVQELCLGGELFDRLDEQPDYHYTEAECAKLVKQMLCAVRYLHSRGIIHRDLKLENFLFSSTDTDSELKLIDFGLSKHFRYGEVQHEAVGTPYTVSPEVIKGSYDERCDIWAVGVISFLLLSGEPPFGGCGGPEPLVQVRTNILNGDFEFEPSDIWDLVSDKAKHFICSLLVINPKNRPTASQAQKHGWLTEWANRTKTDDDHILNPNVVKALVNFKEFSDMRKLLSEVLSFTLLPDQIKDLRKEFEKMDTDGSGEISLTALKQVLVTNAGAGSLGALTEEEVEDIFNAMRVKKTETRIHWHEFIAAGLSQCEVDDRNLRLAFDRLDGDHKGFITLDDIMDLIGSDSLHSEKAMRSMWGNTLNTCNCRTAHITYEDFLLIMKGQTAERSDSVDAVTPGTLMPRIASTGQLESTTAALPIVQEEKDDPIRSFDGISGPHRPLTPVGNPSNPVTPTTSNVPTVETGLSIDNVSGLPQPNVGPAMPTFSPPTTPGRGVVANDYGSPQSQPDILIGEGLDFGNQSSPDFGGAVLPPIPSIPKPSPYTRQKSKSLDDSEMKKSFDLPAAFPSNARRAVALPETDRDTRESLDAKNISALQANRKLYRAHRQMRLSVMDACKRFEEQQARHAHDLILAQKARDGNNKGAAGLVMRRVENKAVTSEEVKQLLEKNRKEQQDLLEKANRRGGRGRRTRKKTISDMSSMMGSLTSEELAGINAQAATTSDRAQRSRKEVPAAPIPPVIETRTFEQENEVLTLRPTVLGDFRKVNDPFTGLLGGTKPTTSTAK